MSGSRLAPAPFLIVYCCTYALVFAKDWPLFRYYPAHGDFNWGAGILTGRGPAMAWYGLMASAALVAAVVTLLTPRSLGERLTGNFLWLFPVATMLTSVFLLRRFLF